MSLRALEIVREECQKIRKRFVVGPTCQAVAQLEKDIIERIEEECIELPEKEIGYESDSP